jgi:hypothetical protein
LSKVAWQAGIPLDQFMLDNAAAVKDLDAALNGTQLLLCSPQQGQCLAACNVLLQACLASECLLSM